MSEGSQCECVSMCVCVYVGPRRGRGEGGDIPEAMHDCCAASLCTRWERPAGERGNYELSRGGATAWE